MSVGAPDGKLRLEGIIRSVWLILLLPLVGQATQVDLKWTAVGDDGHSGGPASKYVLKMSEVPINESNWSRCTELSGLPLPQAPGALEHFTVTGLAPGRKFYFGLKVLDDMWNASGLSNIVELVSQAPTPHDQRGPLGVFPTPFKAETTIGFMATGERLELHVVDLQGRTVFKRAYDTLRAGYQALKWDGKDSGGQDLESGLYVLLVQTRQGILAKGRALLIR